MNKNKTHMIAGRVTALLAAVISLVILVGAQGPLPVVSGQGRPPAASNTPAASIDKIVIDGTNQVEALGNSVIVTRANGEKVQAVTTGLLLYPRDVIETAKNTKVTVLFFESPVSERHDQVIIDGDAKVGIGSSDSWWGRTWVKVKGLFTSQTSYVQVGAHGTEYEFNVSKTGRQATVVMLEGDFLDITRGTFDLVGRLNDLPPAQSVSATKIPQIVPARFNREIGVQQQPGRSLDVPAGEITTFDVTFSVFNECRQRHRVEFRVSDDAPWLQLEVQRSWDLAPVQRLEIKARLSIDGRRLPSGLHRGHVYVVCLDCNREPLCPGSQLDWTYNVNISGATPTPTPALTTTPTPSQTRDFRLRELEQTVIPDSPEPAGPQRASDARVREALDWTNAVILKTQPSYSAEGLIPHFANVEQRSQSFPKAREDAILRHLPGSNKVVGDIYSDWSQPALAAASYNKETTASQASLERFSVDRAEAQRLIGRLSQAHSTILASADSRSAVAQNLLGNIYHDYARIDLDKKDWTRARANLDQAESFYRSALSSLAQGRQTAAGGGGTVQANLAKTQIFQGDVLLQESLAKSPAPAAAIAASVAPQSNAAQLARTKYTSAVQLLSTTQPAESTYPFGVQTLGRALQGLGDAAMLAGEPGAANDAYANAKSYYEHVISAHPDCAEAYFSLADMYDDLGDRVNARLNYRRAIQVRPEQPASYYPLAMLLQAEDPQLAAALAATYLKLEPEVFKQGEKARNAERIVRGEKVPPTIRPGTTRPGTTVPAVVGKLLGSATRELETAAYRVVIDRRPDARPADTVIAQSPLAGTPAPRDLAINLTVSSGPDSGDLLVPTVREMTLAEAKSAIEKAFLRVGRIAEKPDNDKPLGIVSNQQPEGGARVARGSVVNLEVTTKVVDPEPVVPDVRDMTLAQARNAIEKANLRIGRVVEKADNDKPKGTVIKQKPEGGKKVARGSVVELEVTTGKPVEVPDIVDDREATARKKIIDKRLTVGNVSQRPSCESVGKVVEQNPIKKSRVEAGQTVDFTVGSLGDNPVTVPRFIGGSRSDVEVAIRERRFLLSRVRRAETDDARPGTVMDQSPREGTQFAQDCPVKIEITVAEPLTSVGNYVGLSEAEARQAVSGIGLSASVRTRESQDQQGIVIDQTPSAGSRVRRGFPVTLIVSAPVVQLIPVPDVTTGSLLEAKSILEGAGLRLGTITYEEPKFIPGRTVGIPQAAPCRVLRQDPVKDSPVRRGTPVNLWVVAKKDGNGRRLDCLASDPIGDH